MKNKYLLSYNINGWMPINRKMTFEEKITEFAGYVKELYGEPVVIMLQEMIAGRNQKFLKLLRGLFPEYEVITPAFDYHKHCRSIMSVTMIRKDVLEGYSVRVLYEELPNRINYVIATMEGREYRLINAHCVQIANLKNKAPWYVLDRIRYNYEIWELLLKEANQHKNENVVIAGDLQERKEALHIQAMTEMGYLMAGTRQATVCKGFFQEDHIDHILLSKGAYDLMKPVGIMVDTSEMGKLSDHALVYAACTA